jgi:hypothetical protein
MKPVPKGLRFIEHLKIKAFSGLGEANFDLYRGGGAVFRMIFNNEVNKLN